MSQSGDFLEDFHGYAGTLRAWLVAYGVGGPVLFLTHPDSVRRVVDSGYARLIVGLFLVGVLSQVVSAFVNKWLSWVEYSNEVDRQEGDPSKYKRLGSLSGKWVKWIWPELSLDAVAIACFIAATISVVVLLT